VASLNAIKGRPMKIDLCSVTQKDRRILSYMSQATGLMADLDMGTEHLRWMGNNRFVYGYLRGVLTRKACPVAISVKVADRDKHNMLKQYMSVRNSDSATTEAPPTEAAETSTLPPLKYSAEDKDGWVDIDTPILFLNAGKAPFASRDLMQWPLSLPDDGLIDLVLQELIPRSQLLVNMSGAEKGAPFWLNSQHYIKARAYRVKPMGPGYLAIDGEEIPFEDFQVEVHQGMASFLSPVGRYAVEFEVPPPATK